MGQYYFLFALAFAAALTVATLATPLVRSLAVRWGVLDQPAERKVHLSPIPRLGGLAIWLGLWAAALLAAHWIPTDYVLNAPSSVPEIGAIFGGGTVILLVGFADDRLGGMSPVVKLVGQVLACSVLLLFGHMRMVAFGVSWIDVPLTVLWVVGLTNALNLLDNMDGLSAGATSIAGAFFFLLAVLNGQILVALLAAALVGSCLGFLVYNYNPASIFMGDTGSLTLGFVLAVLGMKLQIHDAASLSFPIAALVLSVPIFDTAFVVWRRISEGRRITQGAKDHTSHRLVRLGLNQKQAVWALYGASFLAGLSALVAAQGSTWVVLTVLLPIGIGVIWAGRLLARAQPA